MQEAEPQPAAVHVLFIHGLESGPLGSKVRLLREQGLRVSAPDMHMSMWRLDRRNSVLRCLLRLPGPWAVGLATVLLVGLSVALGAWPLAVLAPLAGAAAVLLLRRRWIAAALSNSRDRCLAIQRAALAADRPDVVLGSSWGGAVAAMLVAHGAWEGPTVLLAPAARALQLRIAPEGYPALLQALVDHAARSPLVVFHDPQDDSVPFDGSRDLGAHPGVELHVVAGGGHRLLGILEDGQLAAVLRRVIGKR